MDAKDTEVNELNEKLKAHEDKFSEVEIKHAKGVEWYEAERKSLHKKVDRLRILRKRYGDMVAEVQSKNAEEMAEL